ncbi:hypothetical protein [Cryobacterium zongtaii]|uniref:hypothetical protein n=1 Tax=Cryobacterium zongtaii TaxID=1259217 RepID=UPI0010570898|nr:hypothetical protein [Cryobacterium zongtaii]
MTTQTGVCPGASVGDGGVDLSADREVNTPGRQGSGSGNGRDGDGGGGSGGGEWDGLPDGVSLVPGGVPVDRGDASGGLGTGPRRQPIVAPADPAVPVCQPQTPCDPDLVVRVSDLVSIPADPPTQGMEPNGWLVVGVPANFFATASAHVRSGTLLGASAEVRFTPVGFRWDYGDGTSRTSASGGATWAALNLPEFSETSTSHVFESTGTLSIGLVVSYSAEYRFAGAEWRDVQGLVLVPTRPITAIADRAGTVLVAESCLGNPGGPGC